MGSPRSSLRKDSDDERCAPRRALHVARTKAVIDLVSAARSPPMQWARPTRAPSTWREPAPPPNSGGAHRMAPGEEPARDVHGDATAERCRPALQQFPSATRRTQSKRL